MIGAALGNVSVVVSSDDDHTAEAYAQRIAKLLGDKEITGQILPIIKQALERDRAKSIQTLNDNGMILAAMLIRKG